MNPTQKLRAQRALDRAISEMGGTLRCAQKLGITHAAISQWDVVPAGRCLKLEKLSGVSRHSLRPDLYPKEQAA